MLKLSSLNITFLDENISQYTEHPEFPKGRQRHIFDRIYPSPRPNTDTKHSPDGGHHLEACSPNGVEDAIDSDCSLCVGLVCVPRAASDTENCFRLVLSWYRVERILPTKVYQQTGRAIF